MKDRILVVDDHAATRRLLCAVLSFQGYEVETAADAEETLAVLRTFRPRLILMDVQLPGMDGLMLTRKLRADPATSDILILAHTAYAMNGSEERAREAGCDGFITKPIGARRLAGVIAWHLARAPGRARDGP